MVEIVSLIFKCIRDYITIEIPSITNELFNKNWVYFFVALISLIMLLVKRKHHETGVHLLLPFSLLTLIIIYNPFVRKVFLLLPATDNSVISRFWIICPIWLIIAYSISNYTYVISKPYKRFLFVSLVVVLLIVSGDSIRSLSMINSPNNVYKIRSESIEIADEVLRLNNYEPAKLLVFEPLSLSGDKFENGGTIHQGIRQYTGEIGEFGYEYSEEEWNTFFISDVNDNGNPDAELYLYRITIQRIYDYYALPADVRVVPRMESYGYHVVGNVGGYYIFCL